MSVTLTATACGSSGTTEAAPARATHTAAPTPTAAPPLTKEEALAQIERYSEINNRANAHNDRKLLDTVEDGPLYAMSVADYKQDEGLPKADRENYKPWSYHLATTDIYTPASPLASRTGSLPSPTAARTTSRPAS